MFWLKAQTNVFTNLLVPEWLWGGLIHLNLTTFWPRIRSGKMLLPGVYGKNEWLRSMFSQNQPLCCFIKKVVFSLDCLIVCPLLETRVSSGLGTLGPKALCKIKILFFRETKIAAIYILIFKDFFGLWSKCYSLHSVHILSCPCVSVSVCPLLETLPSGGLEDFGLRGNHLNKHIKTMCYHFKIFLYWCYCPYMSNAPTFYTLVKLVFYPPPLGPLLPLSTVIKMNNFFSVSSFFSILIILHCFS